MQPLLAAQDIFYALTALLLVCCLLAAKHNNKGSTTGARRYLAIALILHLLLWINFVFVTQHTLDLWRLLSLFLGLLILPAVLPPYHQSKKTLLLTLIAVELIAVALMFFPAVLTIHTTANGLLIHIISSSLANGMMAVAAFFALFLNWFDLSIKKNKNISLTNHFPPLLHMESFLFQLLCLGFALLSIAMISGLLVLPTSLQANLQHKIIYTALSWLVFGFLLLGRLWSGWRSLRVMHLTLFGTAFLFLAYLGLLLITQL